MTLSCRPAFAPPGLAHRAAWLWAAAIVFLALIAPLGRALAADPVFPELTGRIVDNANLIAPEDEQSLRTLLESLEGTSSDQLVIVTLPSLQGFPIEEFGYKLGRHWGIGQKEKDNGVLLIVAPNERKVRIEVGKRLEPILTDALSKLIITNAILPAFRRGDFAQGIRDGVRDIKDVLLGDAEEVKKRARGMGESQGPDLVALIIIALWIALVLYLIWRQSQLARQMPNTLNRRRKSRRRDSDVIVIPGGSGRWDGGWSGGGGGGGGWSGGGGTFSGGGASGGW